MSWNAIPPEERSSCHPFRRRFLGDHCRYCSQLAGFLSLGTPDPLPQRVLGLQQKAGSRIPATCPKCGAAPPAWSIGEKDGACQLCGDDFYLLSTRTMALTKTDTLLPSA